MMQDNRLTRRSLLLSIAGLGGVIVTRGKAFAMSQQTLSASSELGVAYANRCSAQADNGHAALTGDLQALLAQRGGKPGEVLSQTAYCPICGCPVTVTRTVE